MLFIGISGSRLSPYGVIALATEQLCGCVGALVLAFGVSLGRLKNLIRLFQIYLVSLDVAFESDFVRQTILK